MTHDPNEITQTNSRDNNRTQTSRKPRNHPGPPDQTESSARTRTAAEKEADAVHIVRRDSDNASVLDGPVRRRRGLPIANASLYEPSGARSWWWISMRCPHCGSVHLGRVRTEDEAAGPRRAGCGRMVFVKIRQVYRSYASRQVAA
jgi:hypothetical protein